MLAAARFYGEARFYELGSYSTGLARTDTVLVSDNLLLRSPPVGDVKNKKPIAALAAVTGASSNWMILTVFCAKVSPSVTNQVALENLMVRSKHITPVRWVNSCLPRAPTINRKCNMKCDHWLHSTSNGKHFVGFAVLMTPGDQTFYLC